MTASSSGANWETNFSRIKWQKKMDFLSLKKALETGRGSRNHAMPVPLYDASKDTPARPQAAERHSSKMAASKGNDTTPRPSGSPKIIGDLGPGLPGMFLLCASDAHIHRPRVAESVIVEERLAPNARLVQTRASLKNTERRFARPFGRK